MRALVFDGQLRLERERPIPTPPPGQVLLRTLLAGICNTDLEIVRGYAGFRGVLGHEFVARVERAEDESLLGQRVVGEINISCGTCVDCQAGRPTHCARRTVPGIHGQDGTLADYFCLPARNLYAVPDGLPDERAVFVEPLAAACRIPQQVHVRPGQHVIVLGDGKLGLLVAQVLALSGCDLLAVGHHEEKLAILATRGIATRLGHEGLEAEADVVVECTGQAAGFQAARQLVRAQGTLVLKSTYHGKVQADLSALVVDEVHLVGSRCGPFPAALGLRARGLVDVDPLVEAVYSLDEAPAALEHAGRRGALKVLVRP
ncbi:MAG: alcohol dehydrogenase catalytic domain-containing protein [Anaerolineae bacterium]